MVEDVGPRRDDDLERAGLAQEVRRQHLDRRAGLRRRMARITAAKWRGAAIGEIVAVDRGDDDMAQPELLDRDGRVLRLLGSSAPGMPVLTLQKAQARVQVSPMIMKVACFFSQHSPIFGQPASSQTVTSLVLLDDRLVSRHCGEPGALTRIQSGLRSTG